MTHTPMTYEEALTLAVLHSGVAPSRGDYNAHVDGWNFCIGGFNIFIGRDELTNHVVKDLSNPLHERWLSYAHHKLVFAYCEHHHLTLEQA